MVCKLRVWSEICRRFWRFFAYWAFVLSGAAAIIFAIDTWYQGDLSDMRDYIWPNFITPRVSVALSVMWLFFIIYRTTHHWLCKNSE